MAQSPELKGLAVGAALNDVDGNITWAESWPSRHWYGFQHFGVLLVLSCLKSDSDPTNLQHLRQCLLYVHVTVLESTCRRLD